MNLVLPGTNARVRTPLRGMRRALLLLAVVALTAADLRAQAVSVRNDTPTPVIVQFSAVVQGKVVRDRPAALQRGEAARVNLPGNKLISIYDARLPSRVLLQTTLPASPTEAYFAIVSAADGGKVRLEPVDPQTAGKR